jgi:hypothetical protein
VFLLVIAQDPCFSIAPESPALLLKKTYHSHRWKDVTVWRKGIGFKGGVQKGCEELFV